MLHSILMPALILVGTGIVSLVYAAISAVQNPPPPTDAWGRRESTPASRAAVLGMVCIMTVVTVFASAELLS